MKHTMLVILVIAGAMISLLAGSCNGGGGAVIPPPSTGPAFVGSATCSNCHADVVGDWQTTMHSTALETLKAIGQDKNTECLWCHTVGYGMATGFQTETTTGHLGGVQCESCHGAGSEHIAGNGDTAKILTGAQILSAGVCAKCHTDAHHPTADEWKTSKHMEVTLHVAEYFADPVNGLARLASCGACHSGDYKAWVVENGEDPSTIDLRGKAFADMTPVSCSVCHDPHKATGNNAAPGEETQLRHKEFLDPTADPYNGGLPTDINVYTRVNHECGQCHNRRGADPSDAGLQSSTSRPVHHSIQMDFLFGIGGVQIGLPPAQSAHRNNEKQCATCHMYKKEYASDTDPAVTGHEFGVHLEACAPCHSTGDAAARMLNTKSDIESRLFALQSRLNAWGTTANIDGKGALSWQYSSSTYGGPASSKQALIPIEIKRARYNYYYVNHDLSFGVHNAKYARYLLDVANTQLDALGVP